MLRSGLCALLLVIFIHPSFCPLLIVNADAQVRRDERINLNTATAEELMRLPGIGRIIADRIIQYRQKHGLFKRPQDVLIVRGMHPKLYRRLAHLICV